MIDLPPQGEILPPQGEARALRGRCKATTQAPTPVFLNTEPITYANFAGFPTQLANKPLQTRAEHVANRFTQPEIHLYTQPS